MFVRSRGTYSLDNFPKKLIYVLLGKIRKNLFLRADDFIFIHLLTMAGHYGFLRIPGSSGFCK